MKRKLKFRHIEGFRAIMYSGTATGAAAILNVTQPAISQLIKETEDIVGYTLFDRRGGRLSPTAEASSLYEEIDRCYTGIEHINSFCEKMRITKGRTLVIASVPSLALSILPKAIAGYREKSQDTYIKIFPRHSNDAIRLVGSQKCDVGFGNKEIAAPGIRCMPISRSALLCALPRSHHLCGKAEISMDDLNGENFINMSPSEGIEEVLTGHLDAGNVQPHPVGECSMSTVACALVEYGMGITTVDHCAAFMFLDRNIAFRRFVPEVPSVYYAYWLKDDIRSSLVEAFLQHVKSEAEAYERNLAGLLDR